MRTSSVIADIEYDAGMCTLTVEFRSGRVYQYIGVPPATYRALLNAPSLGAYLNTEIKPRYLAREVVRHKRSA